VTFPADVTTRNITSGFPFGLVGDDDDLVLELQLTPSRSMVWASTGSVAVGRKIVQRSQPGQQLVVPVAVTDQAGWLDGAGNAISVAGGGQTHSYGAKVYIKNGATVVAEFPTKNIVVPTGDGSDLDLDLMLPLSTVGGVTVSIPDVWSEQLAAAEAAAESTAEAVDGIPDAIVAALTAPGSPARASLSATYVTKAMQAINIADYGGIGDGAADDTAALVAAYNATPVGGTLYLPPGKTFLLTKASPFQAALTIAKSITISGGGKLKAAAGAAAGLRLIQVTGTDVTIDGIRFDGNGVSQATCIYTTGGASRLTVTSCSFVDPRSGALLLNDNTTDVIFAGNRVRGTGYGILANDNPGISRITITGNVFDGLSASSADAIEFNGVVNPRYDITVTGNTIANYVGTSASTGFGIGFAYVVRGTIAGNVVTNCSRNGIHIECLSQDVTVSGNTVSACGHGGIEVQGESGKTCSAISITGNTIVGCCTAPSINLGNGGIDIGSSTGAPFSGAGASAIVVSDNIVDGCQGAGLYLFAVTHSVVRGNIVRNTYGTSTDTAHAGSAAGRNTAIEIVSCTFTQIMGNRCYDTQATATQFYPLYVFGSVTGTTVIANTFQTNLGGVQDISTGVATALTDTSGSIRFGAAGALGFYGATPVTRSAITGSRTDGTALANLLTTLASLGLVTNSSSA
jgi:hypothetical protein